MVSPSKEKYFILFTTLPGWKKEFRHLLRKENPTIMIFEVLWNVGSFLFAHFWERIERIDWRGPFLFFPSFWEPPLQSSEIFILMDIIFGILKHFYFLSLPIIIVCARVNRSIYLFHFLNKSRVTLSSSFILSSIDGLMFVLSGLKPLER